MGLLTLVGEATADASMAAAGALSLVLSLIIIPTYVFSLLLIGRSVLAWREG